jgi:hypothetical protein
VKVSGEDDEGAADIKNINCDRIAERKKHKNFDLKFKEETMTTMLLHESRSPVHAISLGEIGTKLPLAGSSTPTSHATNRGFY